MHRITIRSEMDGRSAASPMQAFKFGAALLAVVLVAVGCGDDAGMRADTSLEDAGADVTEDVPVVSDTPDAAMDDADGDGFAGVEFGGDDCNDDNAEINPGAAEICDGVDNDCDTGTTEEGLISVDGMNYATIQEAADAASDNATVSLCAGTYDERVVTDRSITFLGRDGAEATTWTSTTGGPALAASGSSAAIEGISFRSIEGTLGMAMPAMWGGAVTFIRARRASVRNCVFEDNGVEPVAGVSAFGGALGGPQGPLEIVGTVFRNNRATLGGAVTHGGSLTVSGGTVFEGNTAVAGGALGMLVATAQTANVDASFERNQARNGGAVFAEVQAGANLSWSGGMIRGNNPEEFGAVAHGGGIAIYLVGASSTTIEDVTLEDNQASYGGAIAVVGENPSTSTVTLRNVQARNNFGRTYGGGIYVSSESSGAEVSVVAEDTRIEENRSTDGGGVGLEGQNGNVRWSGGEVLNNMATQRGGGIQMFVRRSSGSEFTVDNVTVEGNTAGDRGGGLYLANTSADEHSVTLSSLRIIGNTSGRFGGAMSLQRVTATATDLVMDNNQAASGGAIVNRSTNMTLTRGSFTRNRSTESEGVIYLSGGGFRFSGTDVTFGDGEEANTPSEVWALVSRPATTFDVTGAVPTMLCAFDASPICTF